MRTTSRHTRGAPPSLLRWVRSPPPEAAIVPSAAGNRDRWSAHRMSGVFAAHATRTITDLPLADASRLSAPVASATLEESRTPCTQRCICFVEASHAPPQATRRRPAGRLEGTAAKTRSTIGRLGAAARLGRGWLRPTNTIWSLSTRMARRSNGRMAGKQAGANGRQKGLQPPTSARQICSAPAKEDQCLSIRVASYTEGRSRGRYVLLPYVTSCEGGHATAPAKTSTGS